MLLKESGEAGTVAPSQGLLTNCRRSPMWVQEGAAHLVWVCCHGTRWVLCLGGPAGRRSWGTSGMEPGVPQTQLPRVGCLGHGALGAMFTSAVPMPWPSGAMFTLAVPTPWPSGAMFTSAVPTPGPAIPTPTGGSFLLRVPSRMCSHCGDGPLALGLSFGGIESVCKGVWPSALCNSELPLGGDPGHSRSVPEAPGSLTTVSLSQHACCGRFTATAAERVAFPVEPSAQRNVCRAHPAR